MNVLVTGAGGYVGSRLAERLCRDGHRVRAFVHTGGTSVTDRLASLGCEVVAGDVRDKDSVASAVQGNEIIFHIASIFRRSSAPDREYVEVNVEGTRNVLESALDCGVGRVVHCSTVGIHGHVEHPPADENAPENPGDIYQRTKLEGERLALSFSRQHGLPVVVVRPAMIYGPGDTRWLKLFKMAAKKYVFIAGSGKNKLHFVHIDDLVQGFIRAAEKENAAGEAFILAGERDTTLDEFLALIAKALEKGLHNIHLPYGPLYFISWACEKLCIPFNIKPPIYRRRLGFFKNCRSFNIEKAKKLLGYRPRVSLEEGVAECVSGFRKEGLLR